MEHMHAGVPSSFYSNTITSGGGGRSGPAQYERAPYKYSEQRYSSGAYANGMHQEVLSPKAFQLKRLQANALLGSQLLACQTHESFLYTFSSSKSFAAAAAEPVQSPVSEANKGGPLDTSSLPGVASQWLCLLMQGWDGSSAEYVHENGMGRHGREGYDGRYMAPYGGSAYDQPHGHSDNELDEDDVSSLKYSRITFLCESLTACQSRAGPLNSLLPHAPLRNFPTLLKRAHGHHSRLLVICHRASAHLPYACAGGSLSFCACRLGTRRG